MIKINIHDAKTHLSHYLNELEQGETILLCKRNEPVAEIRPIARHSIEDRPIGLAKKYFPYLLLSLMNCQKILLLRLRARAIEHPS